MVETAEDSNPPPPEAEAAAASGGAELKKEDSGGAELKREDSTSLSNSKDGVTKARSKSDVGRGSNKENSSVSNQPAKETEKKKKFSLFGFLKKKDKDDEPPKQEKPQSTNITTNGEPSAEKEKKVEPEEPEPEPQEKKVIVVSTIEDFPEDCQKLIKHSELPREKLEANFKILMNVLHFRTGKIFRTPETVNDPPRAQLPKSTRLKSPEDLVTEVNGEFKKVYRDIEELGKGGFGSVFQARDKERKKLVALKKMEHKSKKQRAANFHEAAILSIISHNNIVRYYTCHEIKDELWMVMELMEGGTFEDAAKAWHFNEANIAYIAKELLKGINYLHNNQFAHRDLKSANIMMSVRGEVKMIDLGLCADMSVGFPTHMVGSPFWMPPEMIQCKPHGYPVDIWSFAISLLEIANQRPPMIESAVKAMFTVGTEGCTEMFAEPEKWSDTFKEFLGLCLKTDPEERATAADLLSHPFIKKADTRANMENILRRIFLSNSLMNSGF